MDEHPATAALRARSPELLVSRLAETLIEGERLRETVIEFGRRTDISPDAFGFAVEEEPGGPRYRSTL